MTTKATRDVIDAAIRPFLSIDINGGTIDGTPIGVSSASEGHFTNLFANNLTVANNLDVSAATVTGTIHAYYADIAEYYTADAAYEPGTVVQLGGEKEVTAATPMEDIYGVIRTNPTLVMNSMLSMEADEGEAVLAVALIGRVPVRVVGPVRKGQKLILSDTPGVAKGAHDIDLMAAMCMHTKIHFATRLVNDDGEEERLIEAALTR